MIWLWQEWGGKVNFKVKLYLRNLSHQNKLFTWLYKQANKAKVYVSRDINDEEYAKRTYKENTGKKLNLDNPRTFDEKLWWLKLNNRDPLLTKCSDKYLVREYVEECGLGHILNELYGVYDNADDIRYELLPERFIIKCNHASGGNIICNDKSTFPREKAAKFLNTKLKSNYYVQSREWNYKDIRPRIICERLLRDKEDKLPVDYKFLCFGGIPKMVFVDLGLCNEDGSHKYGARRNVYDRDFNLLDVKVTRERYPSELARRPDNFEEMWDYAKILSKPFPHCRVDLYNIDDKIYFGEITFYHMGGCNNIEPEEWAIKMGGWIDLSLVKIRKKEY